MSNKPNSGVLFKNDKKENPNQPDYTGSINIKGEEKRISMWVKIAKSGVKYLSVAVSENTQPKQCNKKPDVKNEPFIEDEIPFN